MMDRRKFMLGIAAIGCGGASQVAFDEPGFQPTTPPWEPPDRFPEKDRENLQVSEPPHTCIEVLNTLSLRQCDPFQAVKIAADLGYDRYRTLSVLARAPERYRDDDWLVLPWTNEWYDRRDSFFYACERFGVIGELCLFDRADRPQRERYVIEYIEGAGLDWWDGSTWGASRPGEVAAVRLAGMFCRGLDPAGHVLLEDCNEPGITMSTEMFDPLSQWVIDQGYNLSRCTELNNDGPYPNASIINEHAWGRPNVVQPWPPYDRLSALARRNPGAHITLSTDGFLAERERDALRVAGEVQREGHSFSALFRVTPDLWTGEQRRAHDALMDAAGRD